MSVIGARAVFGYGVGAICATSLVDPAAATVENPPAPVLVQRRPLP